MLTTVSRSPTNLRLSGPERRLSLSVAAFLSLAFLAAIPVAALRVGDVPGFVAVYSSILVVTDGLTAIMLFSQSRINGSTAPAVLGAGYVFTGSLIAVAMATFPGALGAAPLLGGLQTAAWLWVFWHLGFGLVGAAYFALASGPVVGRNEARAPSLALRFAPWAGLLLAGIAAWSATHADGHLPGLTDGNDYGRLVTSGVGPVCFLVNLGAVLVFLVRGERRTLVETWLGLALLAALFDTTLSLIAGQRYTVGWYLSRIDGIFAGSAVLIALAYEFNRLSRVERGMREQSEVQEREADRLRFLSTAARILGESLELETTLARLARQATFALGDRCSIAVFDEGRGVFGVADDDEDVERDRAATLRRLGRADALVLLGADRAVATRAADLRATAGEHELTVPIVIRDEVVGAICCARAASLGPYTPADVTIAEELASRTGLAIVNARLYGRERRLADSLQRAMLPAVLPQLAAVSFDAVHVAAVADADIGGDWYDAFELPDGRIVFSIGDVAGRGLSAAVVMGKMRHAIRAFALTNPDPRAIVRNLDRMLRLDGPLMVTAVVGLVDPAARSLTMANAGHPGPIVVDDGGVETIEAPRSLPLGLIDGEEVEACVLALVPGRLFVFYTDGLIEIDRRVEEAEARLRDVAQGVHVEQSSHPAEQIRAAMVAGAPSDDVAILAIAVPSGPRRSIDVSMPATADSARAMRKAVRRIASEAGLAEDRQLALEVAVGEAIANVIEHAYGVTSGVVRLRASGTATKVSVEVIDFGRWRAARSEGRGHGLNLMKELCPSVEIIREGRSTSVRFSEPISTA